MNYETNDPLNGTDTVTSDPVGDASRLKMRFDSAGYTQAEFGELFGIGSQAQVWQFLNPDKKGGRPLNVVTAAKFAIGLKCSIGDFSPSIQAFVDEITRFSANKTPPQPSVQIDITEIINGYRSADETGRATIRFIAKRALKKKRSGAIEAADFAPKPQAAADPGIPALKDK